MVVVLFSEPVLTEETINLPTPVSGSRSSWSQDLKNQQGLQKAFVCGSSICHSLPYQGSSLVVQWLGLRTFTAESRGSIPGPETKILQATGVAKGKKDLQYKMKTDMKVSLLKYSYNKTLIYLKFITLWFFI